MFVSTARPQEIIATLPASVRVTLVSGGNIGEDPVAARDRLQSYAFGCGFLIVHYRGSITSGRISYKYVHRGAGATPRPHRKTQPITPSAVPQTTIGF